MRLPFALRPGSGRHKTLVLLLSEELKTRSGDLRLSTLSANPLDPRPAEAHLNLPKASETIINRSVLGLRNTEDRAIHPSGRSGCMVRNRTGKSIQPEDSQSPARHLGQLLNYRARRTRAQSQAGQIHQTALLSPSPCPLPSTHKQILSTLPTNGY